MTRHLTTLVLSLAVLLPLGLFPVNADAATGCINDNCPVNFQGISYHGNDLLVTPHVYLVRFSDSPTVLSPATGFPTGAFAPTAPNLAGAIKSVMSNPATTWWKSEYSVPNYHLGAGTYEGVVTIYNPTLADNPTVNDVQISNVLMAAAASGALPDTSASAVYTTIFRSNQTVNVPGCAWHSDITPTGAQQATYIPYIVVPNYANSTHCHVAPSLTPFNNMTAIISHELFEVITDPGGLPAWKNTTTGQELADVCDYGPSPTSTVHFAGAAYVVEHYWSIQAHACLSTPLPTQLGAALVSATSVRASLRTQGAPLANQPVNLMSGATLLASGRTGSAGTLILPFPPQPPGTPLTVTIGNDPALARAKVTIVTASGASITTDAPTIVAAGRYFSFSVRLTPAAQVPITVSSTHGSFTARLDQNGVAVVRTVVPLGLTRLTVSTKNPLARTTFVVRGATPPKLTLVKTGPRSLRATLTGPRPMPGARLTATVLGAGVTITAHTNAAGQASFTFLQPFVSSSALIKVTYFGSPSSLQTSKTMRLAP